MVKEYLQEAVQRCSSILPWLSAQRLRLFLLLPLPRQPRQRQLTVPETLALKAGLPICALNQATLPLQWATAAPTPNRNFAICWATSAGDQSSQACDSIRAAAGGGALSAGAIAGIVLGGTVSLALCVALAIVIYKRRTASKRSREGHAQLPQSKDASDSIAMATLHSGQPGNRGLQKLDPVHSSSAANGVHPHCVR